MEPVAFLPHRTCYLNDPWLVYGTAGCDLVFFIAYTLFTILLVRMALTREANGTRRIQLATAGVFQVCGMTHLTAFVSVWWPVYHLHLLFMAVGAVTSVGALYVFRTFALGVIRIGSQIGEIDELRLKLERLQREPRA